MFKFDGYLGLVDEHGDELFVCREMGENAFDGEKTFKVRIVEQFGPINLSHAPHADAFKKDKFPKNYRMYHEAPPYMRVTNS